MKIGLVIQGPIISGGFTGQTHGYGKTRASEKHLVKFDSNSSIKENVVEGSEYFDEIVLSTWKNEIQFSIVSDNHTDRFYVWFVCSALTT